MTTLNNDLTNSIIFASIEASEKMQKTLLATSEEKAVLINKNMINRLKVNATFCKASNDVLLIIANASSELALEYLLDAKNYKTAQRVLDVAKMLNKDSKYSSIVDYTLVSITKLSSKDQNIKTSLKAVMQDTTQCYSRISNAIKALAFFNIITVDTTIDERTMIINALTVDTKIMLN